MLKLLKSFHNKTERFFEERKREASLKRAVALFVLVVLFVGFVTSFSESGLSNRFFATTFFVGVAFLVGVSAIFATSKFLKGKATFWQLLYCLMLITGAEYLFLTAAGQANLAFEIPLITGALLLFSSILTIYAAATAVKKLNNFSLGQLFIFIIASNVVNAIASIILLYAYILYIASGPSYGVITENYELTELSDGSIQILYNRSYGHCLLNFPSGWQPGTNEEIRDYFVDLYKREINTNLTYKIVYEGNSFYDYNQRVVFSHIPIEYGSQYASGDCDLWREGSARTKKLYSAGFKLEYINYSSANDAGIELCDVKFAHSNGTILHFVDQIFKSKDGFEFKYDSTTHDEDVFLIIKNANCSDN